MASQAPFDLGHEVFSQPQVIEGLLEGFGGLLSLAAVTVEALVYLAITAPSGFGVLFCISFGRGHGELLVPYGSRVDGVKETMPRPGASGTAFSSRVPSFLLSFAAHL